MSPQPVSRCVERDVQSPGGRAAAAGRGECGTTGKTPKDQLWWHIINIKHIQFKQTPF